MTRSFHSTLDELSYVQLLQLAMKYGSGTGLGDISLSTDARIALANAKIMSEPVGGLITDGE